MDIDCLMKLIEVEGDSREGEHRGVKWTIRRMDHTKHLCGYGFFPRSDFDFGVKDGGSGSEYMDIELCVHGGVTFYREKEDEIVVGFDCAHAGDLTPGAELISSILDELFLYRDGNEVYRDMKYVESECRKMIDGAIAKYKK